MEKKQTLDEIAKKVALHDELVEALENMRIMYKQWKKQDPSTNGYKWAIEAESVLQKAKQI